MKKTQRKELVIISKLGGPGYPIKNTFPPLMYDSGYIEDFLLKEKEKRLQERLHFLPEKADEDIKPK